MPPFQDRFYGQFNDAMQSKNKALWLREKAANELSVENIDFMRAVVDFKRLCAGEEPLHYVIPLDGYRELPQAVIGRNAGQWIFRYMVNDTQPSDAKAGWVEINISYPERQRLRALAQEQDPFLSFQPDSFDAAVREVQGQYQNLTWRQYLRQAEEPARREFFDLRDENDATNDSAFAKIGKFFSDLTAPRGRGRR